MSLLHTLKLRFSPPRFLDPDFGELLYMYIPTAPDRSYWETERWFFSPTGREVGIGLLGDETGPLPEARRFYLSLPEQFAPLLDLARPKLDQVFRDWYGRPISDDIWQDVELTGFGLEDPRIAPVQWDMAFEATGPKWLGISIPFLDRVPGKGVVDT